MLALAGNFIFIIGALAIVVELLKRGSQTAQVTNSLSGLLTNSIKAAKS